MSVTELLSIGSSLGGGLISASADRKQGQRNRRLASSQFASQMDESIQRRVADAKAAGIHPLFALGASVGASPTAHTGGGGPTGSAMGDALQNIARTLGLSERNAAASARDTAEAQWLDAQRVELQGNLASRGRDGLSSDLGPAGSLSPVDQPPATVYGPPEFYKPEVPYSSRPGVRSGPVPERLDFVVGDGRTLTVLNPDLNLDEISQVDYVVQKMRLATTDKIEDIVNFHKSAKGVRGQYSLWAAENALKQAKLLNTDAARITIADWKRRLNQAKQYLQRKFK